MGDSASPKNVGACLHAINTPPAFTSPITRQRAPIFSVPIRPIRPIRPSLSAHYRFASTHPTASCAAASPNAPVTHTAVPKPLAQSSFRFVPGSDSVPHVPSAHG
jgi:hypothetical protein